MSNPSRGNRFNALDQLRATAMLLGVFYHALLFGGMMGGGPPGGFGPNNGPGGFSGLQMTQEWLHSFRMPMFFLISGFFCRMMFEKYGLQRYLVRRWLRIGLPLLIGIFTFVPLYQLASQNFLRIGGPGMGGPPGGGPVRPSRDAGLAGSAPFHLDDLPPPPPGFVPPPLQRFDANHDGSIDADEWRLARRELPPPPPGFGPPGFGFSGDDFPERENQPSPSSEPIASIHPRSFEGSGDKVRERRPVPRGPGPGGMFSPPGPVSTWLFGRSVQFFTLSHLWFLWYLFVFATLAPVAAIVIAKGIHQLECLFEKDENAWQLGGADRTNVVPVAADRFARAAGRWQLVPFLLGLLILPALLITRTPFGWSLGFAAGIGRAFPDFLWHFEFDMPFYFIFFFTGWWLHRQNHILPLLASGWWLNLGIGLSAHFLAARLSQTYAMQTELPHYGVLRLIGYGLYCLGSAYTVCGFLGAFQRFANQPNAIGRYLADTAFWVYLMHQALLLPFLAWLGPFKLVWWANGGLACLLTTAASLLLYESFVRPTPLNRVFGPGAGSKPIVDTSPVPILS